ncbi:MAG: triphosphoribosyl-dephospho-CoA synthase [Halobacteriales archaeon]|nr:triphosphoribosyl-dephospho-CoA synthase [Halobacteriales archaeon]
MRTPAEDAQVALLLEAGTQKPGNVGPMRDFDDTTFHHFLAGAVGARRGFDAVENGEDGTDIGVGDAFLRSVRGCSTHEGGNTQFGALLLLAPLVVASARGTVGDVEDVVEETTPEDAVRFYEAFDHVDVYVGDVDDDYDYDVGDDEARERVAEDGVTLYDVMEDSASRDGVAREWTSGFERTFHAASRMETRRGGTREAVRATYIDLLCEEPDSLVAEKHGKETAREVTRMARELPPDELDALLADEGINPGTTADIVAGAVFVALRRGWSV